MTDAKGASVPGFQHPIEFLGDLINHQAMDEGLWFIAETASEAYLQQELRKLHSAAESIVEQYRLWKRESGDG